MQDDWEINPDNYQKDDNGDFKLKVDGTPRKKVGRAKGSKGRGYNHHSETKARIAARKQVNDKTKRLKTAQAKVEKYKKSIDTTKKTLDKLDNKGQAKEGLVLTEEQLQDYL